MDANLDNSGHLMVEIQKNPSMDARTVHKITKKGDLGESLCGYS